MRIEDVEIHVTRPQGNYRVLGQIKEGIPFTGIAWAVGQKPTPDAVYQKLRERAALLGANAVIDVEIRTSYWPRNKLEGTGVAVVLESDVMKCAFCAETIKREARICRFCGRDVVAGSQPRVAPGRPNPRQDSEDEWTLAAPGPSAPTRPCWCNLVKGEHDVRDHPWKADD